MIRRMAACTSCGAALPAADAQCRRCGAKAVPELELQVPVRPSTRTAAQKPKAPQEEISLELAVDPRALVAERSSGPPPSSGPGGFPNVQAMPSGVIARGQQAALARSPTGTGLMPSPHPAPSPGLAPAPDPTPAGPAVGDLAFDARLLADYGDAPSGVLRAPFYAWRVLR